MNKKSFSTVDDGVPINLRPIIKMHQQKNLKKIVEITEESQTIKKQSVKEQESEKQNEVPQKTSLQKIKQYFTCIKKLIEKCLQKDHQYDLNVEQSQISYMVQRIRKKQMFSDVVLPPKSYQNVLKNTLVLDLDETLVYTEFKQPSKYDFQIQVQSKGKIVTGYVTKRFGVESFLFQMSKLYEIIIFSGNKKVYTDSIIAEIDSKQWISHVLSLQHCISLNKNYYLKPLKILGRPMDSIVLIDDNRMAGILNPQNFYKIQSFRGNPKDRKLIKLGSFLKYLSSQKSMIPILLNKRNFQNLQIRINQESMSKRKLKAKHMRKISEMGLFKETQQASNTEFCREEKFNM